MVNKGFTTFVWAAFVWCLAVLALHGFLAASACNETTSSSTSCAMSSHQDFVYTGVLRDARDQVLANTPFAVAFGSRRLVGAGAVGGFSTDQNGGYCILWAYELTVPILIVNGHDVAQAPVGHALNGAGPPSGCQPGDSGIPWNRTDDLAGTFEFSSVAIAGVMSLGLLLLALLLSHPGLSTAVRDTAVRLGAAGLALTLMTTGLALFVWLLLPGLQ